MLASTLIIRLRSLTRKLGINKFLGMVISRGLYEDRFGAAFHAQIIPGDVVWDIGANVGLYTATFYDATGPAGQVVAFEPTQACFRKLVEMFSDNSRVVLKNIAVGDVDGVLTMAIEPDVLAATHRVVMGDGGEGLVTVDVRSAASLVAANPELFPNIVKIDVEGHEGLVLDGFESLLSDRRLHCVGIEVHFGLLEERGESGRPKQMEQTLKRHGFQTLWTDPSHLLATR